MGRSADVEGAVRSDREGKYLDFGSFPEEFPRTIWRNAKDRTLVASPVVDGSVKRVRQRPHNRLFGVMHDVK